MLRNPRDDDGRVVCLICGQAIDAEPARKAGRLVYHVACWRPFAEGERKWPW